MDLNGKSLRKIFLGVAGCIILYWLLHETQQLMAVFRGVTGILSPFLVGAALAFVLNVPMRAYEKLLRKIPKAGLRRALSMLMTFASVILLLVGVFALLIPQLWETFQSITVQLPKFFAEVQSKVTAYLNDRPELIQWISKYTDFENMDFSGFVQSAIGIVTNGLGNVFTKMLEAIITLGTGIFNAILSLVFAIYCLARKEILIRQARRLIYSIFPERVCDEIVRIMRMTNATFSRFISGQCLEAVILGSMFAIAMTIFGMPYVALISVIISITALVPIIGAFAGCIIGAFFILVVDPGQAFWFVVLFLVLQQIEGNLIYPKVVGSSVGLPGMWVLLAVAVGGDLMGVGGMLLMIPVSSVLYALAREFTQKRLSVRNVPREKLQVQPIDLSRKKAEKKPQKEKQEETQK